MLIIRLVSIQQGSSEGFPTTLLLINTHSNDDPKRVVAHCKVSPVSVYHPSACFVESGNNENILGNKMLI